MDFQPVVRHPGTVRVTRTKNGLEQEQINFNTCTVKTPVAQLPRDMSPQTSRPIVNFSNFNYQLKYLLLIKFTYFLFFSIMPLDELSLCLI